MIGDSLKRLFNGQRDVLVKLPVWTTAEDRRRALSYADRDLDAQAAIDAVQAGKPAPDNLGVIVAAARYEDAGWMPDGSFDRWCRLTRRGAEQLDVPAMVQWLGDVELGMRRERDLAMPEGLSDQGRRAHEVIVTYLRERGFADNGGCKAFYSPIEWVAREETYGTESHLIVVYDGGAIRPVFSMDAAYDLDCAVFRETGKTRTPYGLYEGMQERLRAAGLYFDECTSYYSAIYAETD